MQDKSRVIFGNQMSAGVVRKAERAKAGYVRRFGDDTGTPCHLRAEEAPVVGAAFGVRQLLPAAPGTGAFNLEADLAATGAGTNTAAAAETPAVRPLVVGNIRMGFGHYRIAMAMASAAHALGFTPYWMDLTAFPDTTCSKVIGHQNDLYSLGSRLSQKSRLFNKLYWEPLNSEGFRKISYNASDQKVSELMCAPFADLPRDVPFIGTHVWPAQAAVHAGMQHVVNAIPDNWPMGLHLAEGALHTVQTPSAYLGYKTLRGMDRGRVLRPMPEDALAYTGHYIDHELVVNIPADCARRTERLAAGAPVRYLLTVGGAGAQQALFRGIIRHLLPQVEAGRAALLVNVGDHRGAWEALVRDLPALAQATRHFDDFAGTAAFAEAALDGPVQGVHAFCDADIFAAVYATNLLMRACDLLVTKPSELAFYPVPKVMIHRVGGHEAWGAVRAAELGDGTYELETLPEVCGFMDLVQAERGVVADMCENILAADAQGVYNGAYRVVNLASSMA